MMSDVGISLCRLCCCKMYAGESMLLQDTEKIKAWFRWFNAVELEVLPGYSNEFCHFCLHKIDIFLRCVRGNEKVLSGSDAKLARRTCLDRGTYGWSFCRLCLGHVQYPDRTLTIEKYGTSELNALAELLGFKLKFIPDYPDYLCNLCVSGMHKFINSFILNKDNLTPHLEMFWRRLKKVPVPKLDVLVPIDSLPDIRNPSTSIVEVLFSSITIPNLKQWLGMHTQPQQQETSPSVPNPTPSPVLHHPQQKPFLPSTLRAPNVTVGSFPPSHQLHENLQRHVDQLRVNQYLSTARNMLTNMQPHPFTPNVVSPVAVQMAMAQQLGGNPFLASYNLPLIGLGPNPFMQPYARMPPPPAPMAPPLPLPAQNHMSNLFVKRMNEDFNKQESPPEKKRRSRKSSVGPFHIPPSPVLDSGLASNEGGNSTRPDQFMLEGARRGPIVFDNSMAPLVSQAAPSAQTSPMLHYSPAPLNQHSEVIRPVAHVQTAPVFLSSAATHTSNTAPLYQQFSNPAPSSSPVAKTVSPPAINPQLSLSPSAQFTSSLPQTELPHERNALPSFNNAFSQGVRITLTPSVASNSNVASVETQNCSMPSSTSPQNSLISSSSVPELSKSIPNDNGPKLGNTSLTSSTTSPPKNDQEQRVPPIKIKLSDIYSNKKSPSQNRFSPSRGRLPEIVQRNVSPLADEKEQEKITAYRGDQEQASSDGFDDLSLKSLLENSPPSMRVPDLPEELVAKIDGNLNYRELQGNPTTVN